MRRVLNSVGLTTLLVLLAACGDRRDEVSPVQTAGEPPVLHVFNWVDYIAPSTIADFEARTGIKVVYDVYESNEVLETRLLTGGSGYDIVVPNGGGTRRLGDAGALQPIDRARLKNYGNLDPEILTRAAVNDPGNRHAIPYLWGTTGIGYNPDLVEKALGTRTIDSLAAVFDPAIASRLATCGITWLDAPADMFSLALIYLGLPHNSERAEDIAAAEALLKRARPYVRAIDSAQFVSNLASGEVCVSVAWSNSVLQATSAGDEAEAAVKVLYAIPKEGAPLWCDMVAIPVDAPHPQNAYAFLDYLMEPEVIAQISNAMRSANGNAASRPHLAEVVRDNPVIYPNAEVMNRLTIDQAQSPEHMRTVTRAWTRIKSGQ
jgi:putrescine transport system substrate-binding protein